ncbi:MAG: MarR family winged helix-turn-helix transcriptional regulator [Coriobacteriia bacterium]|nr:MarR family winged helix-turn-helix transcriptional regulator [Coriobacteriia bacterium]
MDKDLREAYEDLLGAVNKMRTIGHASRYLVEGVTPVEMRALVVILFSRRDEDEVRPSLVAHRLGTTKSALSQILRSLEEKGFIERRRSEKDSRAVVLELTSKGESSLMKLRESCDSEMMALVSHIGLDDLRHLKLTVDKIVEFYESLGESPVGSKSAHLEGEPLPHPPFAPCWPDGDEEGDAPCA